MGCWSAWLLCCVCAVVSVAVDGVRVRTSLGELEGGELTTSSGRLVYTFLGVPYARPPLGEDRFKEPKPVKSWSGVWPARDYSSDCIQLSIVEPIAGQITGDEDCLYLNVFTPNTSNPSGLPVMVFFHGGAFMFGEGRGYNPDYLLDRYDIVLVTLNYRLGPFGFLSTEDDVVSGNFGLKDQTCALKWVRDHIAAFGGDPSRVTIAGNSAGGVSVQYHFLSPLSRGLFRAGISSSGSALMPWALTDQPLAKATRLSAAVGCPTNDTQSIVQCLRQRTSRQILSQVTPLFTPWMNNPIVPFGPVIESSTINAFLNEHPYQLLKRGAFFDVPWLASLTSEEGLFPAAAFIDREELLTQLEHDWKKIAPQLFDFNFTSATENHASISEAIKQHYFGNEAITIKTANQLIKAVSDRLFNANMEQALRLQASVATTPVHLYRLAYRGSISLTDLLTRTGANFGVSHFDDLFYLLAPLGTAGKLTSAADKDMITVMTDMWATFVETGHPLVSWPPVQSDPTRLPHLLIRGPSDMQVTSSENFGNYQFWSSIELNENENYHRINKPVITSICKCG